MKRTYRGLLGAFVGFAALLYSPTLALAATAPPLGVLQQFSVLGASTVTSAGVLTVTSGDVGVSPGTSITGTINVAPGFFIRTPLTSPADAALLTSAQLAASNASTNLLSQGPGSTIVAELGGTTLTPGVYSFTSTANIANNTTLTLDAGGDANAIWIFLVGSAITANTGSNVVFLNGVGNPCNVFWRVGSDATIEGDSFPGTVIAGASMAGSVTLGSGSSVSGRAVSLTAAVTTAGATQTIGGCASVAATCPTITVNPATLPIPIVGKAYNATVTASGGSGSYTFAVTSGALPDGLVLNSATGVISGTPTHVENSSFTITATDTSTFCFGFRSYVLPAVAATGVPTLDYAGLAILLALLAGGGLFVMKRFSL